MSASNLNCHWIHPKFDYIEAKTVEEANFLLSEKKDKAKLIAGGTDLLVAARRRKIALQYVIDIKTIANLDQIQYDTKSLTLGALTSLSEIETSSLIREKFPIISESARQIGTPQIRNMGTIGGNLCNAAPSADMAPALIGLSAKVKIKGMRGERIVTLEDFFMGPGETVLQHDEMITEIIVPNRPPFNRGAYVKLPARTMIDLAVVSVAALVMLDSKKSDIVDAKIVLGAVAPTPIRARQAEEAIKGKKVSEELIIRAAQIASEEAKPISDIRASTSYRKEMVRVLTIQAIKQAIISNSVNETN